MMTTEREEQFWGIHFEDPDKNMEVFTEEAPARERFKQASFMWNCHLFAPAAELDSLRAQLAALKRRIYIADTAETCGVLPKWEPTEQQPQIDFYEAVVDSLRYPVEDDPRQGSIVIEDLKAQLAAKDAEIERLTKRPEGHAQQCYYCHEPTNDLAGNPGMRSIALSHPEDPGVVKWHHEKCVSERLLSTETEHLEEDLSTIGDSLERYRRGECLPLSAINADERLNAEGAEYRAALEAISSDVARWSIPNVGSYAGGETYAATNERLKGIATKALASSTAGSDLLARLKAAEERKQWTCFHCGFETNDMAEAAAHFGDRDDPDETKPLCRWWKDMSPEERGEQLQDLIQQRNQEQEENALLRTRIEGLEYRCETQKSEIHSFKPFRTCDTIHEVFNVYDSMEGRALLAEEQRDTAKENALTILAMKDATDEQSAEQESDMRALAEALREISSIAQSIPRPDIAGIAFSAIARPNVARLLKAGA